MISKGSAPTESTTYYVMQRIEIHFTCTSFGSRRKTSLEYPYRVHRSARRFTVGVELHHQIPLIGQRTMCPGSLILIPRYRRLAARANLDHQLGHRPQRKALTGGIPVLYLSRD